MRNVVMKSLVLLAILLLPSLAHAQPRQVIATCGSGVTLAVGDGVNGYVNTSGQDCTAASVSASISGFTAASTGTPISVTTGGVTGTLPAGAVVVATNAGTTNAAYCKLGASATTSDQYIAPGGGWFAFTVGASTQLTCITSASTTTVNMVGGAGLPTGVGGAVAGSTTVVTQPTAANLNATVIGAGSAGTANAGVVTVQGIASMTKILVTPDTNSAVNVAQFGGTNVVNGGVAGSQSIGGTVATNVAITANPINLGAQAVSSENAAVTTARQVQLVADLYGKLITLPYANSENFVSGAITSAMTGTTSTSLIAAPASGLRNYLTNCVFSNSHATVGTDILIQDGSGGTTLYVVPAAPAFGGASITFPVPLRQPTTATAIFVANVTTGSNTKASCSGFKGG